MINRTVLAFISFFVCGGGLSYGAAPPCGTPLGAPYKGIYALSNGDYQGTGDSCIETKGTHGWEYQCVEFIRRFYSLAVGINTSSWNGTGDAVDYFATAAAKGLTAYANGGTIAPAPDDILVFSGKTFGHVAIVTAVSGNQVQVIEQNWSPTGVASLPLLVSAGHYSIADRGSSYKYKVLGWVRKPGLPPPPPPGSILFSNLGPGDTFVSMNGWGFASGIYGPGLGPGIGNATRIATKFISTRTASVSQIEVAASRTIDANFTAWLMTDNNGQPGTVLETFSLFQSPSAPLSIVLGSSAVHPVLSAGSAYWLALGPANFTSSIGAWWPNSIGANTTIAWQAYDQFGNFGGWIFYPTTQPAFRITGQ